MMNTKILHIKVILFVVLQCVFMSAVNSEDPICKVGEGVYASGAIITYGSASKCSGWDKITTEAECKLAAEYNSKNNIDKNKGYGGRWTGPGRWSWPPGCIYMSGDKYYWIEYTKSTGKCSTSLRCICNTKTCINCPPGTYQDETGSTKCKTEDNDNNSDSDDDSSDDEDKPKEELLPPLPKFTRRKREPPNPDIPWISAIPMSNELDELKTRIKQIEFNRDEEYLPFFCLID